MGQTGAARGSLQGVPAHPAIGDDVIRRAVLCDECDAVFASIERIPNYELIEEAHRDGWKSTATYGTWKNTCPDHD